MTVTLMTKELMRVINIGPYYCFKMHYIFSTPLLHMFLVFHS